MIDIPKWHHFMKPLLEVLKENGEMPRQEAIDAVVDKVGLSEEQLSVLNEGNGKSKARGRVGWASSCLLYTSPSPRDVVPSRMPSSA